MSEILEPLIDLSETLFENLSIIFVRLAKASLDALIMFLEDILDIFEHHYLDRLLKVITKLVNAVTTLFIETIILLDSQLHILEYSLLYVFLSKYLSSISALVVLILLMAFIGVGRYYDSLFLFLSRGNMTNFYNFINITLE